MESENEMKQHVKKCLIVGINGDGKKIKRKKKSKYLT